jgi:anti-sigma regulatory factor (Ser/Thr protein kinase)
LLRRLRGRGFDEVTVSLAVTEAVANVVLHAYPTGGGDVTVTVDTVGDDLVVVVSDSGVGGHSFQSSGQAGLGLGLALIRELSTSATIAPTSEGTAVTMRFAGQARRSG